MGQGRGKSRQHSNTEYGVLQAHTQALAPAPFQQLPTTLGMGRLDRTVPKKVKLTRGRKRGMGHQYKRRNKQRSGKGGGPKGLASEAKPAHVVFPVGTTTKPLTYAQVIPFEPTLYK